MFDTFEKYNSNNCMFINVYKLTVISIVYVHLKTKLSTCNIYTFFRILIS